MKIGIVGGGIGGLVSGWLAVEAGHQVEIFEQEKLGAGASGKALGVLVPVTGMDRPIDRLQRAGIAAWPELAQRLSVASGIAVGEFWREWDLEGIGMRAGQVRLPLIFEVLRLAIEAKGGFVHEGVRVEAPALLLGTRMAGFDRVVLASGLGNVELAGAQMKVSAGLACRMRGKVDQLVAGDNLFVCPDWDGTVIAGSVNWDLQEAGNGEIPADKLAELLRRVEVLVPGLELIEAWVGYRPMEVPRLPLVRDLGDGVLAIVGLGKIGIGMGPMLDIGG